MQNFTSFKRFARDYLYDLRVRGLNMTQIPLTQRKILINLTTLNYSSM